MGPHDYRRDLHPCGRVLLPDVHLRPAAGGLMPLVPRVVRYVARHRACRLAEPTRLTPSMPHGPRSASAARPSCLLRGVAWRVTYRSRLRSRRGRHALRQTFHALFRLARLFFLPGRKCRKPRPAGSQSRSPFFLILDRMLLMSPHLSICRCLSGNSLYTSPDKIDPRLRICDLIQAKRRSSRSGALGRCLETVSGFALRFVGLLRIFLVILTGAALGTPLAPGSPTKRRTST